MTSISASTSGSSRMTLRPKRKTITSRHLIVKEDAKRTCVSSTGPKLNQVSEEYIFSDGDDSDADLLHSPDYQEYTGNSPRNSVVTSEQYTDDEVDMLMIQGTDDIPEGASWAQVLRSLTPSCLPDSDCVMEPLPSLSQGVVNATNTFIDQSMVDTQLGQSPYFQRLCSALDKHILMEKPSLLPMDQIGEIEDPQVKKSSLKSLPENLSSEQTKPTGNDCKIMNSEKKAALALKAPTLASEVSKKQKKGSSSNGALLPCAPQSSVLNKSNDSKLSKTQTIKGRKKASQLEIPSELSETLADVSSTKNPNAANVAFLEILRKLTPPRPKAAGEGIPRIVVGPHPLDVFYNKEGGSFLYCGVDLCGKTETLMSSLEENSENMTHAFNNIVKTDKNIPSTNGGNDIELPLECDLVFEDGTRLPQEEQQYLQFAVPPTIPMSTRRTVLRFRLNKVSNNYDKRCLCLRIRVRGMPSFGSVTTTPIDVRSKRKTMSAAVRNKITMDALVCHWNAWAKDPSSRC